MEATKITSMAVEPYFDLEDFMNFVRETRMENETLQEIFRKLEEWSGKLSVRALERGSSRWLVVWLPGEVEQQVDDAWDESPGTGFMLNSLAQYLCMGVIQRLFPQIAEGGCAPAPKPGENLRQALRDAGLDYRDMTSGALDRRYAVLTFYPFKGGCEICHMRPACPKGNGKGEEFASVVLPGYERGRD